MHRNIYIAIYTCPCVYVCVRVDIYGEVKRRSKRSTALMLQRLGGVGLHCTGWGVTRYLYIQGACIYVDTLQRTATHCNTLQHTAAHSHANTCTHVKEGKRKFGDFREYMFD